MATCFAKSTSINPHEAGSSHRSGLNATTCFYPSSGLGRVSNVNTTTPANCLAKALSEPSIFLNSSATNRTVVKAYDLYVYGNAAYMAVYMLMNAGIAAFRAGNAPHIIQVFEVGTATMMSATGAIKPVYQMMTEAGEPFDPKAYLPAITGYYSTAKGEMLSFPFNSSSMVMWVNKDALKKAGLLTRDPRQHERKKYGQKGARKRFQFSKR